MKTLKETMVDYLMQANSQKTDCDDWYNYDNSIDINVFYDSSAGYASVSAYAVEHGRTNTNRLIEQCYTYLGMGV